MSSAQTTANPAVLAQSTSSAISADCKIRAAILQGGGVATLKTVEGGILRFRMNGTSNILIEDEEGGMADITIADVMQANGVTQVVDHVLMP